TEKLDHLALELNDMIQFWIKPYFGLLVLNLQEKNLEKSVEYVDKLQNLILENWPRLILKKMDKINYLKKIYQILNENSNQEYLLISNILLFKTMIYHHTKQKEYLLTKEEKLKYYLANNNNSNVVAGILPFLKN